MSDITVHGSQMILDTQDILDLRKYGTYEPFVTHLLQERITSEMICVDAGAHIGYHTLLMAEQAKHVHAFEPHPELLKILHQNLNLNGVSNVTVFPLALDSEDRKANLYLSPVTGTCHQLYDPKEDWLSVEVSASRLDSVLFKVDFMKIDVEGYEAHVLRGASELIESGNPLSMIVEVWPSKIRETGEDPLDFLKWLQSQGFRFWMVKDMNVGPLISVTAQDVMEYEPTGGYVYTWMERE